MIQSSYSFVDESNRLVCPTSNNHVLMLKATDDEGNVLPEFEKVLDIDIKAAAEENLEKHWIRIFFLSYLIMMEICGLQQVDSVFILIENSKGQLVIFPGRPLILF
mgnify:FL=1